jgi:hypothetical protein
MSRAATMQWGHLPLAGDAAMQSAAMREEPRR